MLRRRTHVTVMLTTIVVVLLLGAGLAIAFSDVPSGSDYEEAINDLSGLGIINGFEDGNFRPNELVTRQQFAKMIVLTLGLQPTENDVCPFSDVDVSGPGNLYPDNFVAVAAARGITKGKSANRFAPFDNITRAQVMSMVVRAAPLGGATITYPTSSYYSDPKRIMRDFDDPNHGLNAQAAELSGLLWGIRMDVGGEWDPWRNATRGEVAQILWRLRQKMGPPSTTTTTTELPSNLLYSDDFSDSNSGWLTGGDSTYSFGYDKGAYGIGVFEPDTLRFSWAPTEPFDDVVVQAKAFSIYYSGDWNYGLVFRLRDDSNFYFLNVVGDSNAAIWRIANGQWQQLSDTVDLPPIASSGWRDLGVTMLGDQLIGYVDGVEVGPVTDTRFASGKVGFAAGTFTNQQDVTVYFDDLSVWRVVY